MSICLQYEFVIEFESITSKTLVVHKEFQEAWKEIEGLATWKIPQYKGLIEFIDGMIDYDKDCVDEDLNIHEFVLQYPNEDISRVDSKVSL